MDTILITVVRNANSDIVIMVPILHRFGNDNLMGFKNQMNINKSWLILADTIKYQTVAFSIIIVLLQWFITKDQMYNLPSPQVCVPSVSTHNLIKESKPYQWHLNKSMLSSCYGAASCGTPYLQHKIFIAYRCSLTYWDQIYCCWVREEFHNFFFCFRCSWLNWQSNFKVDLAYWQ